MLFQSLAPSQFSSLPRQQPLDSTSRNAHCHHPLQTIPCTQAQPLLLLPESWIPQQTRIQKPHSHQQPSTTSTSTACPLLQERAQWGVEGH